MTVEQLAKVDAREADAIHALMHCENEQACTRCNPHNGYADAEQAEYYSGDKPRVHHRRGPDSCEDYYRGCRCKLCVGREKQQLTLTGTF